MATRYWIGKAIPVAQLTTVTVGGTLSSETFTISVGGVAIASHTDADTVIATTVAALVSAWNTSAHPYATGITAVDASPDITLTADNAGEPFVITLNTPGGSATFAQVATTTSVGPNDWSVAANWSGATVPVTSDTAVIENSTVNILWGLDQSAVTLAELRVMKSYTGVIGLLQSVFVASANGASVDASVNEYRDDYLQVSATILNVGISVSAGSEVGSGRIKVDLGSNQTTASICGTASTPTDSGLSAARLLGTHASNRLMVVSGTVGTATDNATEVSTWSNVSTPLSQSGGSPVVVIGDGCTLTDIIVGSGRVTNRGANVTTATISSGQYTTLGTATHTTITIDGGDVLYGSNGTITNLNCTSTMDFGADTRAKTVTNCQLYRGYELLASTGDPLSVTFTNGIDLVRCGMGDGTIDLGTHLTITTSSI